MLCYAKLSFVCLFVCLLAGGVVSFTIRSDQVSHYEPKLNELEEQKKWQLISKTTLPYFANDELPTESFFFAFRVTK